MRIKENVILYICEYCKKKYFIKRFAEHHEKFCRKQPSNDHKCFQHCVHLTKGYENYTTEDGDGWQENPVQRVTFKCEKTGKFLYSVIAEKLNIVPTYNDYDAVGREYERMPLECDLYLDQIDADINEHLNL